jgi:hypothetical protein
VCDERLEHEDEPVRPLANAFDDGIDFARAVDRRPFEGRELEGALDPLSIWLTRVATEHDGSEPTHER